MKLYRPSETARRLVGAIKDVCRDYRLGLANVTSYLGYREVSTGDTILGDLLFFDDQYSFADNMARLFYAPNGLQNTWLFFTEEHPEPKPDASFLDGDGYSIDLVIWPNVCIVYEGTRKDRSYYGHTRYVHTRSISPTFAVEIDGPHHDKPGQKASDNEKDSVLSLRGYHIMRVSYRDIDNNVAG